MKPRAQRLLTVNPDCDCMACETQVIHMEASRPLWEKVLFIAFILAAVLFGSCKVVKAAEMLSPHFSKEEFNQHLSPLPLSSFDMDPRLVHKLEELRLIVCSRPIIITSGYRSQRYNAQVHGAHRSQHMFGRAADIKVNGVDNRMLGNYARIVGFSFVKVYSNHVHVDVR